jgi:hypothetical protein
MKTIPIIQFLYPRGEKRPLMCDVSDDVADKYENEIAPLGLRITAECLRNSNLVSLCIEEPELGDFVGVLAENRIDKPRIVLDAIESMIRKFNLEEFEFWRKSLS